MFIDHSGLYHDQVFLIGFVIRTFGDVPDCIKLLKNISQTVPHSNFTFEKPPLTRIIHKVIILILQGLNLSKNTGLVRC